MISVHETEKLSLQQIEQFLLAAKEVRFEASQREEIYGWVERLLCQQEYMGQGRRARGLLRRYLGKMTGLSRAQLNALGGPLPGHGAGADQNQSPPSFSHSLYESGYRVT